MKKKLHAGKRMIAITAIAACCLTMAPVSKPATAAIPMLDQIRVGLFLNADKFLSNTPIATLTSAQGFDVAFRNAGTGAKWPISGDARTIRASLDEFSIKLAEFADAASAQAASGKLDAKYKSTVYAESRSGKTVYSLYIGQTYPTKANADAAKTEVATLYPAAEVKGSLHLNAGTYATEADAVKQLAAINNAGVHAFLVYHENSTGALQYSVWIGQEIDATALTALKASANALLPGVSLIPADTSLNYILRRASLSDTGSETLAHFFINSKGQKVTVSPKASFITVKERANRSYRGLIELSHYKGELAVINELPFEEYLYSVVGSEMSTGWPAEALKAQAVAARSFALAEASNLDVAHVVDSVLDQAYYGTGKEATDIISAVNATKGEILTVNNNPVSAFFHSNAGGKTSDGTEVWGNPVSYTKPVVSPDEIAAKGKSPWHRLVLADGRSGYISSIYVKDTGLKNPAGLPYYTATEVDVKVRKLPYYSTTENLPLTSVGPKDRFVSIGIVPDSNDFAWMEGPFKGSDLLDRIKAVAPGTTSINSLTVTGRGPSGRVTEVAVNGKPVKPKSPDSWRTALGGLQSTLFDIEETGRYTITGAGGVSRDTSTTPGPLYVATASATTAQPATADMYVLNGDGTVRVISQEPRFVISGRGNGHGLGMSQWGARSMATDGIDYKRILQLYYSGATLTKG